MNEKEVDRWISENGENDATLLFRQIMPKHVGKLKKLDFQLKKILDEIREIFPDACFYTASGGFNLILGSTHEGVECKPQRQRTGWNGKHAEIGDGDW